MTIIRILLVLVIITFFMPFYAVSCNSQDKGVIFSGFELSTGKNIAGYWIDGNFLGFILIVPPVILLILSLFIDDIGKIKNMIIYNIFKYMSFIAPVFDIFAVFTVRYAFRTIIFARFDKVPVLINVKSGFLLYIFFNAAVFILAVMNYFIKRE